jgi:hypothetical protein
MKIHAKLGFTQPSDLREVYLQKTTIENHVMANNSQNPLSQVCWKEYLLG